MPQALNLLPSGGKSALQALDRLELNSRAGLPSPQEETGLIVIGYPFSIHPAYVAETFATLAEAAKDLRADALRTGRMKIVLNASPRGSNWSDSGPSPFTPASSRSRRRPPRR